MGESVHKTVQSGEAGRLTGALGGEPGLAATSSDGERGSIAAARMRIIGDVVGLMLATPVYRNLLIADIEWRILPPMAMGQCRLIRQGELPVAFVTWAKVSEEVEKRLTSAPELRLTHSDWKSGSRNCVIDIIALPPAADVVLSNIGQNVFPGETYTVRGLPPDQLAKMREILMRSSKASHTATS